MTASPTPPAPTRQTFRATVTAQHTIILPADLRHELDIAAGDIVEITVDGGQTTLRKVADHPMSELSGLLADYFTDREDVERFIDAERSAWDE
jgi:AbrB family looped-hinge helix DNA binding protein